MTDILPYIANVVGIIAVTVFVLSYQQKTRTGIVVCNAVSRTLYVVQYLMLFAFEGAILDIIGVGVSILAQNRNRPFIKRHLRLFFIASNLSVIIAGLLLYKNVFSLFPMMGVLLHTGAFWLNDERKIRIVSFIGSPFWFVYNLVSLAYGSAVGDLLTMASIATAFVRYDIMKKGKPNSKESNTREAVVDQKEKK